MFKGTDCRKNEGKPISQCRPFRGPEPGFHGRPNRSTNSIDRREIERNFAPYFVAARTLWDRRSWVFCLRVCRLSRCQWAVCVVDPPLLSEWVFKIVCGQQVWKDKERITYTSPPSGLLKRAPRTNTVAYLCSPSLCSSRPSGRILF